MRSIYFFIYFISFFTLHAQDVKISKHFISNEHWRVAVGINLDVALANKDGESNFIKYLEPNIPKDINNFGNSGSYGFDVDIYSANSVVGFYTSANFNKSRVIFEDKTLNRKDSISLNLLEVPLYLKLRIGSTNGHGQLWLAFGGGYAFPQTSSIKSFNSNDNLIYEIEDKGIANSFPFVSAIVGYELVLGNKDDFEQKDNYRFLFYVKYNRDMGNRLNTAYNFDNQTLISDYPNSNMQFQKISFGITFLMRINAFARIMKQNLSQ